MIFDILSINHGKYLQKRPPGFTDPGRRSKKQLKIEKDFGCRILRIGVILHLIIKSVFNQS
jgi:hypothetical protein